MTDPDPSTGRVPLVLLSNALDEIYALRRACAYEAAACRATMGSTHLLKVDRLLEPLVTDILVPAALGHARTLKVSERLTLTREGWQAARSLSIVTEPDLEWTADEATFLVALDEIRALRKATKRAARVLPDVLLAKTLPSPRRRVVGHQISRLRACAEGRAESAYAGQPSMVMRHAMLRIGAEPNLTRSDFEAEIG